MKKVREKVREPDSSLIRGKKQGSKAITYIHTPYSHTGIWGCFVVVFVDTH